MIIKDLVSPLERGLRGVLFITQQNSDNVLKLLIVDDKLILEEKLEDFSFPHGVDVFPSPKGEGIRGEVLLAVSNYGDNSVTIQKIS